MTSVDCYLRHMKHNQFDKSSTYFVHAIHEGNEKHTGSVEIGTYGVAHEAAAEKSCIL